MCDWLEGQQVLHCHLFLLGEGTHCNHHHRLYLADSAWSVSSSTRKEEEGDANKAWVRGLMEDLKKFRAATNYINLALPEWKKRQASDFYGPHLQRLRELKLKWDPDNFFRFQTCLTD